MDKIKKITHNPTKFLTTNMPNGKKSMQIGTNNNVSTWC